MINEEAIKEFERELEWAELNTYPYVSKERIEADKMAIKALKQEPKTGHWIEKISEDGCGERHSYWACSECGRNVGYNLANIEDVYSDYSYCHCGARMIDL